MANDDEDPVQAAHAGRIDLYDVATWSVRTWLDRLSVRVWTSLHRARQLVFLSLAIGLFVAELGFIATLVADRPTLGILALFSVIPAAALAGYLWYDDPTLREPLDTIAITFVLAVGFASIAALLNTFVLGLLQSVVWIPGVAVFGPALFFFLFVGPIEESVKWLAVRTYSFRRPEFGAVVDGVVYGAIAGLGFATIENLTYIIQGYLFSGSASLPGQIEQAIGIATSRAFVGPGHVIYSAFAGYYLGLAKFNPEHKGPLVVKGLLIAAFIHGLYNTTVTYLEFSGPVFVAFVVVYDGFWLAVLYRKLSRYRKLYQRVNQPGR